VRRCGWYRCDVLRALEVWTGFVMFTDFGPLELFGFFCVSAVVFFTDGLVSGTSFAFKRCFLNGYRVELAAWIVVCGDALESKDIHYLSGYSLAIWCLLAEEYTNK